MRMRSDLVCVSREIGGATHWIIKDPIRLAYHDYVERAYFLLSLFDGRRSVSEIKTEFQQRFQSDLPETELNTYVSTFVRDEVVVLDHENDGKRLFSRHKQITNNSWRRFFSNPLAIKLPGWNLTRVFDRLMPLTQWAIQPISLVLISLLAFIAFGLVFLNATEVYARLPLATDFFASQNIVMLVLCLSAIKLVHEFAHAMVCKHLGAECHEVGFMFLVLAPCMYCDVSDSWMIHSKWKRIAIASAGIATDLFLASVATLLWWFSEPGSFNSLCLNIMFIAGLGSILFNANPLLRYDGYFVLSDLVGIPNLWAKAKKQLSTRLNKWLWDAQLDDSTNDRHQWFLIGYAIASFLYRVLIVCSILYFVLNLLTEYKLDFLAVILTLFSIWGLLIKPSLAYVAHVFELVVHGKSSRWRTSFTLVLFLTGVGIVVFLPLPYWISVPAYTELRDAERLYVKTAGVLSDHLEYGSQIRANDIVAEFEWHNLRMREEQLVGKIEMNKARIQALETLRVWNPKAGDQIPTLQEVVRGFEQSLLSVQEEISLLKVTCGRDGILIKPRTLKQNATKNSSLVSDDLGFWSGKPLREKNLAAFFETGSLIGLVGDPNLLDSYALIRQENADLIRVGQAAKTQLGSSPHRIIEGTVESISLMREAELPADVRDFLAARFHNEIQMSEIESGKIYLARIKLDTGSQSGLNFESAKARIRVKNCTLLKRFSRFVARTFSSLFD